jgi:hypothetical protein
VWCKIPAGSVVTGARPHRDDREGERFPSVSIFSCRRRALMS